MSGDLFARLKEWLRINKTNFVTHYDWLGSTEGGFFEGDDFDMDALLKEIDAFSEQLKKEGRQ